MGKTRGDNLAPAIALGEPGGERSGPGPLLARYVGVAVMFVGLAGLAPLAVLPAYPDEVALAPCFIFPGIGAAMAGYLVYFASPDPAPGARLTRGQAAACTVLVWVLAIAVYALPYVAAGLLSPVQAVFESTSGLTTTGLSVVDVDACPAIFLFHRSLTCYLGGVGLVLILTCVVTQTGGLGVYNAEGHTDHLLPSAAKTARMILLIYNGLIIAGAVAYWAAGMTPFDAINISMCAVPTGGFATHGESIAYWNSPVIEAITIVLMVAGGTNFLLLFLLLRGKLKAFLTHIETPLYFGTIAVMALFYGVSHWNSWFAAMIYLKDRSKYPLQLFLREMLVLQDGAGVTTEEEMLAENLKYATIVVATVPILFIYPFIQRYFVKGVMVGALKG